jgi:ATP-dependent DNA ligase
MLTKDLSTAKRVQPRFIEPMCAEAVRELPDGGLWTYEAKLDGYRCLAAKRSSGVVLWSRRGNGFTARFAEIARACEKLPPETLIDGEVVAIDESGRASFNALQHSRQMSRSGIGDADGQAGLGDRLSLSTSPQQCKSLSPPPMLVFVDGNHAVCKIRPDSN